MRGLLSHFLKQNLFLSSFKRRATHYCAAEDLDPLYIQYQGQILEDLLEREELIESSLWIIKKDHMNVFIKIFLYKEEAYSSIGANV